MGLLVGPAGRTSWTDQLDGPAGQTSWTDQLDESAGWTSSLYLKPWPVHIFADWPFSLYIIAASQSDKGLVHPVLVTFNLWKVKKNTNFWRKKGFQHANHECSPCFWPMKWLQNQIYNHWICRFYYRNNFINQNISKKL